MFVRVLLFFIAACLGASYAKVRLQMPVDLSWPFDKGTFYWPGAKKFNFTKVVGEFREDGSWYATNEYESAEHGGTHLDAPYHFSKNGWKVGSIPLENLIARGICMNFKNLTEKYGAKAVLLPEHIEKWEEDNFQIPRESIVLIQFGWSQHYGRKQYFYDDDDKMNFPGISGAAAELFRERGIFGLGIDTASTDVGSSSTFEAHKVFGNAQIYTMENVKIPKSFPVQNFNLIVMPMKIRDGTGAPVRVVAVPETYPYLKCSSVNNR